MYIESIEIINVGPIEHIKIDCPMRGANPKPVIIVGENGTGKSILLSHIVNSLIIGQENVFDDGEIEVGRVYKIRSPHYIKSGQDFSYASIKLTSGIEIQEIQLNKTKENFEKILGYVPAKNIWNSMQPTDSSILISTFYQKPEDTLSLYQKQCNLYFPVNRFEEPAWLNIDNLKKKANYSDLKYISRHSNRNLICTSPLKNNRDWLLDLIFDRQLFDIKVQHIPKQISYSAESRVTSTILGYEGQAANIYEAVIAVLKIILGEEGNIRLGAGIRKNRQISVMKDENIWVPNLFQLSTGEIQLLNLFLSIIRDYDLSEGELNDLNDIKGIVIIDEIDSHLHTSHQKDLLPKLISSFPNVQFFITTHSPLFLIGMEQKFGNENFCIFNMPDAKQVAASDFSEFNSAYEAFKETNKHREEIRLQLEQNAKPMLFVEGDYDIRYLRKASELLEKKEILDRLQLINGDGYGNLDKIWKSLDNAISPVLLNKIILLYDCDTKKQPTAKGNLIKEIIPSITENPISIGIENLFKLDLIEKSEIYNPNFIDTEDATAKRIRGVETQIPAKKSVNKDEKGNLCNWICENGTAEDFSNFEAIFNKIKILIN